MAKVRPPRKKEPLDLAATAVKILKKTKAPLSLKKLLEKINSLPEIKKTISLSNLHNELNFDGRFVFLKNQGWLLKTQVPDLERDELEDFDLVEDDYEWDVEKDDDEDDDEDDLLVPFDEDLEIDIDEIDDDLDDTLDDVIDDLEDIDDEIDPLEDLSDFEDLEDLENIEDADLEKDDDNPIL